MDVSKFALDRNAYLNTAAAIYESTKQQVNSYSSYLDPSVLTKAYFDSKMYSDRATSNYLAIYGGQSGGLNNNLELDRDSGSQLSDQDNKQSLNEHLDAFNGGNGGQSSNMANYQAFAQQQQQAPSSAAPQQTVTYTAGGSSAENRRPLTVIF